MPGETVIAIGSPVGLGRTVTTGIVSALNRSMTIEEQTFEGLIQTDAAVNQGNSGGALLNVLGEWIGVNSAIASLSGGGSDGISFAIPMETVKAFLSRAIQTGRVTGRWAGFEFGDDPKGDVRIASVFPVGPAIREGVRQGSRVLEVDGRPVANAVFATFAMLDAAPRGQVEVTLGDGRERRSVKLSLEAPPTERLAWERIGLKAEEVTPELREQTGYPVGSGILVREVREDGPAARVGVEPGDLILLLGAQNLRESEDLLEVLQWSEKGAVAPLTLVRLVREQVRTPFGPQVRSRLEKLSARVALE
jgi:serine protease Do